MSEERSEPRDRTAAGAFWLFNAPVISYLNAAPRGRPARTRAAPASAVEGVRPAVVASDRSTVAGVSPVVVGANSGAGEAAVAVEIPARSSDGDHA